MSSENLWGELPAADQLRTPLQILKEQAKYLTEMTQGVIVGWVTTSDWPGHDFSFDLNVRAPALNDYQTTLLSIGYPVTMYPASVRNPDSLTATQHRDEGAFLAGLKSQLQSPRVRNVINALLAQSNSMRYG
jgi:hypothetical protein